jgi:hypothetical protein
MTRPRFRWVQCQLDEIIQCRSEDAIREQLANLPQDLFHTYKRILQRIMRKEDKNLAKHTLLWLVTAKRPLRLEEIVGALALRKNSTSLPSKPAILRDTELLEICGSLVTYDQATKIVTLSHFSVKVRPSGTNLRIALHIMVRIFINSLCLGVSRIREAGRRVGLL